MASIPINLTNSIAKQLMFYGKVTRRHLDILIQALSPELAKSFNLKHNDGVLVAQVMAGSPAASAGVKQSDIIISFRGKPVPSVSIF